MFLTGQGDLSQNAYCDALHYNHDDGGVSWNAAHVIISRLRQKLKPFGVSIEKPRGCGWRIERERLPTVERILAHGIKGALR